MTRQPKVTWEHVDALCRALKLMPTGDMDRIVEQAKLMRSRLEEYTELKRSGKIRVTHTHTYLVKDISKEGLK